MDEISTDESLRNASRSFRQAFQVPPSERLVSCKTTQKTTPTTCIITRYIDYSCAYYAKRFTNQGWMYLSENYLAFYSYLLGHETRLLLELKNIQDIKKARSKQGVFPDAIELCMNDNSKVSFQARTQREYTNKY